MPTPRRRRVLIAAAVAGGLVVVAAAVLGYGAKSGWFNPGSEEGTSEGFKPAAAPKGVAAASAWPQYGFDANRTRANPDLDLAPPYRVRWSYDARSLLEFPPVVGGGRVIVGTNDGLALALDQQTGKVLWRTHLVGQMASSPALAPGIALFTTTRGRLVALDVATGRRLWGWKAGRSIESSPLVADGSAYVGTLEGKVLRIGLASHHPVWVAEASGDVKASLALAGPNVVIGDYAGRISAFRRTDGRLAWRATSPSAAFRSAGRFYGGPAVAYGRVYIGNVNGRVIALDAANGQRAWLRVLDDFVYSSAAVDRRLVLVGSYDHRLHALDAVTGEERWSFDAGERISGSPSVVGRYAYVSTLAPKGATGATYAVDVETGRRVWTFPDGRYSPAVGVEGMLVLTGRERLYGLVPR